MIFTRKYTKAEQEEIIKTMIINIDSREKRNEHITNLYDQRNIKYKVEKMDFADYTFIIPKNESLDIEDDILFHDLVSIERKSGLNELCINITKGRKQFKAEYERHKGQMILMIEDDKYNDICDQNYRSKVSRQSLLGTLHKWQHEYDVPFIFIDKGYVAAYIHQVFKYYLKYYFDNQAI